MDPHELESITAISPLDGRYRRITAPLAEYVSEYALMKFRVKVEIEWFIYLTYHVGLPGVEKPAEVQLEQCRMISDCFSVEEAKRVREIEKETNHDVKAVERFIRNEFCARGLDSYVEWIHFGCTSEDINNLAYGMMLQGIKENLLYRIFENFLEELLDFAADTTHIAMLSRTHGQPATPSTLGKELVVFASRIDRLLDKFWLVELYGKMNGAVGNYSAHQVAYPELDWMTIGPEFVQSLELKPNLVTTQIEPHDYMVEYFSALRALNGVMMDFVKDVWGYISIGYFRQKKVEGEVGSSTMPHKVNPIDFENAEGNLGLANALLSHLSDKLQVSRWQRDLSDSTVLRNIGTAVGHTVLAVNSARRGLAKLDHDPRRMSDELANSWEVLTEAVQTVMRAEGIPDAYEQVKKATRGSHLDATSYRSLLNRLTMSRSARSTLLKLRPEHYDGLASQLANQEISRIRRYRNFQNSPEFNNEEE